MAEEQKVQDIRSRSQRGLVWMVYCECSTQVFDGVGQKWSISGVKPSLRERGLHSQTTATAKSGREHTNLEIETIHRSKRIARQGSVVY